ncbi:serine protease [Halocynthiibacter sp. C4]|uniref:serine protease n=1 Tax=Halocynthiibacter sp. C4 TaxID=2992758 RepID=UPI00237AE503|nr:serine protease [Halocynthiibacter sp. C4]MDE0590119.1 serine protease [Halocynthiibacter sp. C4]
MRILRHYLTLFLFVLLPFSFALSAQTANAQQASWIQIEAHPSLNEAQVRAQAFAGAFDNVNGFRSNSGWYVIALGPYDAVTAENELQRLAVENLIPADSYLVKSDRFTQQYWPIGANRLDDTVVALPVPESSLTETDPVTSLTYLPDETPREARASERLLSREAKMELQRAMQWEGFYNAAIDGDFGRGTRNAMALYQRAKGYDETGILTTRQRAELLENYNAILSSLGMEAYTDTKAGITIRLPMAMVEFDGYEAPFAHFTPTTDDGVRVSLISQYGDQATLFGLYEIMQTLEIVPLNGERERNQNNFTLTGENNDISSYTYATLAGGTIKGFTLVWPAGDNKRMERVVSSMRASFTPNDSIALDDMASDGDAPQSVDLLAGLEIRKPKSARSGFYLDGSGHILTTTEAVAQCSKITVEDGIEATVAFSDEALGISVLKPQEPVAPIAYAQFAEAAPRLNSDVAVAGFSFGGALDAPTLTFGKLSDVKGLNGEPNLQRLAMSPLPGDAGGPVVNAAGSVIGMLQPNEARDGRSLPNSVSFSSASDAITEALRANGIKVSKANGETALHPLDLTTIASDMTVLVACWE